MGNNRVWMIVVAIAIAAFGWWYFMSGGDEYAGATGEPVAIEDTETPEEPGAEEAEEDEDGDD